MSDCIDILRSISATCASINQIGGVDKRAWVTQLNQIESYTFDSNGYVNSLVTKEIGTTNYRYELAQIVGKKNTHSGNYEGVVGENVSLVKQNAILKIYTDSPSDRDKVVDLFDAQELVVFFENSNGKIEVFGLDKGLEGSALVGGTGTEMQDDTAVTITLTGDQNKLPYFFLYGGSLATSIEYLDSIGLNPIYSIQSYTAGTSTIDFTNNGGDDWDIGFKITPDTVQSTANITGYQYSVNFWNSGVHTPLSGGFKTTDFTFNTAGNGAGVYNIYQTYLFDDSSFFRINKLIKVDASGNIIASVSMLGATVNSANGLVIDITANVIQVGVSYPIQWISFDAFPPSSFNVLGTTTTINAPLTIDSIGLGYQTTLGSLFTDDFTDNNGSASVVTIS